MKTNIHVETPEGDVISHTNKEKPAAGKDVAANKDDVAANAAGAKANPDPRANENLKEDEKTNTGDGPGTEITDGEAG